MHIFPRQIFSVPYFHQRVSVLFSLSNFCLLGNAHFHFNAPFLREQRRKEPDSSQTRPNARPPLSIHAPLSWINPIPITDIEELGLPPKLCPVPPTGSIVRRSPFHVQNRQSLLSGLSKPKTPKLLPEFLRHQEPQFWKIGKTKDFTKGLRRRHLSRKGYEIPRFKASSPDASKKPGHRT